MSWNSISRANIESVAEKLLTVISSKKELLQNAAENIKFVETIIGYMDNLKNLVAKGKAKLTQHNKEISEMKAKYDCLVDLDGIKNDNINESDLVLYVECESIISDKVDYMDKNSLENINQAIEISLDQIAGQINGKVASESVIKRNNVEKFKEKPIKNLDKSKLEKAYSERTLNPSNKIAKSTILLKRKGAISSLVGIKASPKDTKSFAKELISSEKLCEICNKYTQFALILGHNCVLCIECLKKIVEKNNTLVDNALDAQNKKQTTICACPNHGWPISPKILLILFGEQKIEDACLTALKKQLKYKSLLTKSFPNVCMDCKGAIKDERNTAEAIALCQKHKVCTKCYK